MRQAGSREWLGALAFSLAVLAPVFACFLIFTRVDSGVLKILAAASFTAGSIVTLTAVCAGFHLRVRTLSALLTLSGMFVLFLAVWIIVVLPGALTCWSCSSSPDDSEIRFTNAVMAVLYAYFFGLLTVVSTAFVGTGFIAARWFLGRSGRPDGFPD